MWFGGCRPDAVDPVLKTNSEVSPVFLWSFGHVNR